MSLILQIDDLEVDQFITLYKPTIIDISEGEEEREKQAANKHPLMALGMMGGKGSTEYDILHGRILQVKALNLPYIAISFIDPILTEDKGISKPFPLDVRKCSFIKLQENYVKVMLGENLWKKMNGEEVEENKDPLTEQMKQLSAMRVYIESLQKEGVTFPFLKEKNDDNKE